MIALTTLIPIVSGLGDLIVGSPGLLVDWVI